MFCKWYDCRFALSDALTNKPMTAVSMNIQKYNNTQLRCIAIKAPKYENNWIVSES